MASSSVPVLDWALLVSRDLQAQAAVAWQALLVVDLEAQATRGWALVERTSWSHVVGVALAVAALARLVGWRGGARRCVHLGALAVQFMLLELGCGALVFLLREQPQEQDADQLEATLRLRQLARAVAAHNVPALMYAAQRLATLARPLFVYRLTAGYLQDAGAALCAHRVVPARAVAPRRPAAPAVLRR